MELFRKCSSNQGNLKNAAFHFYLDRKKLSQQNVSRCDHVISLTKGFLKQNSIEITCDCRIFKFNNNNNKVYLYCNSIKKKASQTIIVFHKLFVKNSSCDRVLSLMELKFQQISDKSR